MRANFSADLNAAGARFAEETHASRRADVLTMDLMIAKFREQNVAHHDRFLARGRPAGQTKQRTPIAFMNDTVADEVVILAMTEHRNSNHPRVLDGAAH